MATIKHKHHPSRSRRASCKANFVLPGRAGMSVPSRLLPPCNLFGLILMCVFGRRDASGYR